MIFFLVACNSREENLQIELLKTDSPMKVLLSSSKSGNNKVKIFIPQEFKVTSAPSAIKVSSIRFSETGANIYGSRGTEIYTYDESGLEIAKIERQLSKNNIYKFYVGYFNSISDYEKENILANYIQKGTKYGNNIYDIKNNDSLFKKLKNKISDSIRGYIHLNYTNPETEQFDYLNIPVEF
ncbi:hypothetical protein [Tamlana sp. 2_MG-2023]|uniref:hypothetical protein n=1 Tax=Tamlana sp. 2_MG-2023 TaxID=3062683 RepID=UPI0026E39C52|nr:hypothetical protein [Tamlana sp. 2_MG-2023]